MERRFLKFQSFSMRPRSLIVLEKFAGTSRKLDILTIQRITSRSPRKEKRERVGGAFGLHAPSLAHLC
jgi:hypothetical protein